jgi:diguanylate cyclase (GGDEF)-like protein
MRRLAPASDGVVVARLGGDEFGILLPDGLAVEAARIADVLRAELAAAPPVVGLVQVSASIGTGVADSGPGLSEALAAADRGVYAEKRRQGAGRYTTQAAGS